MNQRRSPATLRDVATASGVSISCVSVILNGTKSGTRVSQTTRAEVIAQATRLGYRPNAIGRSLQRRRTLVIGFLSMAFTLDAGNAFLADLIGGMQEACRERDHALLLFSLRDDASVEECLSKLTAGYVDGLIVFGRSDHPVSSALAQMHLPLVSIVDPIPGMPSVRVDDRLGGEQMASELFGLGYTRALYRLPVFSATSIDDRVEAFLKMSTRLGMDVTLGSKVHADSGAEFSESELRWLRSDRGAKSVVVVWEDHTALPTVALLEQLGFKVPEDIGVAGYNGSHFGPWLPSLTTIKAPWRQVAMQSVYVLLRQIDGAPFEHTTVLPTEFISGTTTRRCLDHGRSIVSGPESIGILTTNHSH